MTHFGRRYEQMYRGVFLSPLDYDLTLTIAESAKIKLLCSEHLDQEERTAIYKIDRLTQLGGLLEGPHSRVLSLEEVDGLAKLVKSHVA